MKKEDGMLFMCGFCTYFNKSRGGDVDEGYCSNKANTLIYKRKVYTSTDASSCVKNGFYNKY